MNSKMQDYVQKKFKGRNGTARLGFNSEKELYNIFAKIFGTDKQLSSDLI
jgi:hypothetical protein